MNPPLGNITDEEIYWALSFCTCILKQRKSTFTAIDCYANAQPTNPVSLISPTIMWPSISLILLIILANSIHCHLDDSEHDFSHHELQPRATPGDGFTFDIADTDLVVTITFAARIITDIVRHGLLTVLDQKASSMAPNENPSRIIIWPKIEDDLYFSGVFEIVHQCPDPPLNVALLQGLRKGIGEYFQTHPDENLAFNFYGYITSKSDLSSNLFAFRMSFANPGVLRSEKKDGVHLGLPDLNVIYDVKRRILELTEPDDLVLFIGNTARSVKH